MKYHLLIFLTGIFYYNFSSLKQTEPGKLEELKSFMRDKSCEAEQHTRNASIYELNKMCPKNLPTSKSALDCLGLRNDYFTRALDYYLKMDANGKKALKVKFHAMSRSKPEKVTLRYGENFNMSVIDFDITRRTILIVHGFLSNGNENWINDMANALLKWDDVNIFIVDWSAGSNTWNYMKAAINTRTVGDQIATFLGQLVNASNESNEIDSNNYGFLHLIGHSLGSHICGYASMELKRRQSKWLVRRITGLDPAQPCFLNADKSLKLDSNDAPLVDVIHTNGKVFKELGLGIPHPVGRIDFYPNGGKKQPGCFVKSTSIWNYLPLPLNKIQETICSHGRSYLLFTDSIITSIRHSCTFWAFKWDLSKNISVVEPTCNTKNCIEMGINADKYSVNGTFFTVTTKSAPFCMVDEDDIKKVARPASVR